MKKDRLGKSKNGGGSGMGKHDPGCIRGLAGKGVTTLGNSQMEKSRA